jgi:xylan 1,4-beta-xylosidase
MYSSYTAASIAREYALADKHKVNLEGALTWAFEFEDQPYFAGQRVLSTNGIDLPVLNVFRMLSKMGGRRVATVSTGEISLEDIMRDGVRGTPDVGAITSLENGRLSILLWHYHDDDIAGPDARVSLHLRNLPPSAAIARAVDYRIDQTHSNAFATWQALGSPPAPNPLEYARLQAAGRLATIEDIPQEVSVRGGASTVEVVLPRRAVSLIVLELN